MKEREIYFNRSIDARKAPPNNAAQMAAREKKRKKRRAERLRNQAIFLAVCVLVLTGLITGVTHLVGGIIEKNRVEAAQGSYEPVNYDVSGYAFNGADPRLILVNNQILLSESYTAETEVADEETGKELQLEAAAAYREMAAAAKAQEVSLVLCSGYRDVAYQGTLFEKRKQKYLDQGLSEEEAYAKAKTIVAIPGGSEHATGYAADIVTEDYTELDTGFAQTAAYAWLVRYGAEYGFILRYPEDKQMITGIVYEPWHWRYVGVENAKAIKESGLSLEEFIECKGQVLSE